MSRKKPRGKRKLPKVNYRRRDEEFAGLKKELHPRTRWEYLDMDYADKLSDEDKKMLSKFVDEYYGASLSPADQPDNWTNDFHSTPELRKECMDRNNARNRDMYTILRTRGMVEFDTHKSVIMFEEKDTDDLADEVIYKKPPNEFTNPEDALIEFMDRAEEVSDLLQKAEESAAANPSQQDQPESPQEPLKQPQ